MNNILLNKNPTEVSGVTDNIRVTQRSVLTLLAIWASISFCSQWHTKEWLASYLTFSDSLNQMSSWLFKVRLIGEGFWHMSREKLELTPSQP